MLISVNIPATNLTNLDICLSHIELAKKEYNDIDVEVIVNNVLEREDITNLIKKFGYKEIKKFTNILESRYIMAMESNGDYILLLDDTRFISKNFFSIIKNEPTDMGFFKEIQLGINPYSKLSNIHNSLFTERNAVLNPMNTRFILPRLYKRKLILHSLDQIINNVPKDIFKKIKAMDLELIYYETFIKKPSYRFYDSVIIYHLPVNLKSDVRKMYKYGQNTRFLASTKYKMLGNLRGRTRNWKVMMRHPEVSLYLAIRGIPFVLGYYSRNFQKLFSVLQW
ncbi:MAG: hypothetical protein ACP5NC_03780 [Nitrososphaeria archaeon]